MARVKHNPLRDKTGKDEQNKKASLLTKCWSYLNDNFQSFSQTNKIKISLELCKKDIPQEVKGDLFGSAEVARIIARLSDKDLQRLIEAGAEGEGEQGST